MSNNQLLSPTQQADSNRTGNGSNEGTYSPPVKEVSIGPGAISTANQAKQGLVERILAHVATVLSANKPDDESLKAPFNTATEIIRKASSGAAGGSRKRSKKSKRRRTLRK